MLDKRIQEHMRHYIDAEVSTMISENRNITPID